MAADDDADTSRTVVKTYVPTYQKREWKDHADELGMSQSEFVRTMVQAGRKGFEPDPVEAGSPDANPRGNDLEDRVLDLLASDGHLSWDQLVERLAGDFEDRLEDALQGLQNSNRVQYSGRHGGYAVVEGDDGGR